MVTCGHCCLLPDFKENASNTLPLSITIDLDSWWILFFTLWEVVKKIPNPLNLGNCYLSGLKRVEAQLSKVALIRIKNRKEIPRRELLRYHVRQSFMSCPAGHFTFLASTNKIPVASLVSVIEPPLPPPIFSNVL